MGINTFSTSLVRASSQAWETAAGAIEPTANFTFQAWYKPTSTATRFDVCCKTRTTGAAAYLFGIAIGVANKFEMYLQGGTDVNAATTTSVTANAWNHICITYDGTTANFYIGGSSTADTTSSITHGTMNYEGSHPMSIGGSLSGADAGPFQCFDGSIDEVRWWSTILTGAQNNANYNSELVGNESGLIGYWKFNNSAVDSQTNGTAHDLTGMGSPTYSTDVPFVGTASSTTPVPNLLLLGVG